jgi:beta-lactamase regulating signal transducer with metallopeptidase domain
MIERILVVLVNLSLQFILVFIVAQLMVTIFRIRSASARYAVWLVVVLCPLVLIPMNIVSSDIVIFSSNNFDWNRAINLEQMPDNALNLSSGNTTTETQPTDSVTPTQTEPEIPLYMRFLNNVLINLPLILVAVWLIGVSWCFIRLGSGYFRLRKLLSKAYEVRDEDMLEIFDHVRSTIKLSRPVRLFASSEVSVPISIGIIHPCIILPDNMLVGSTDINLHGKILNPPSPLFQRGNISVSHFNKEENAPISNFSKDNISISPFGKGGKGGFERMILIHEMAHLKRFDYLVNMICQVIRSFMFFHPIFHLSVRRFELAVEQNCDGMAIGLTGKDTDYAEFLLSLSRANMGRYPVCSGMDGSSLKERIIAILEKKEAFKKMSKKGIVSLLVVILSVVFIVSMVRLVDAAQLGLQPSSPAGGNYLSLNGKDNYAVLDFNTFGALFKKGTKELTVEAWVYPTSVPDKDTVAVILGQQIMIYVAGNGNSLYQNAKKWINLNNDDLVLMMFANEPDGKSTGSMFLALSRNKWHHIAFQVQDKQVTWVCDNTTSFIPQGISSIEDDLSKIPDMPSKDFVLGGYGMKKVEPFITWDSFAGYIDEVRISNIPRYDISKGQFIPQERFEPDANTIALWHFNERNSSDIFHDSSGNNYHLIGKNGASIGGPFAVNEHNKLTTTWANIKVENRK